MQRIRPYIVIINSDEDLKNWTPGKWLPKPTEYPVLAVIRADNFEEYFYIHELQEILTQMEALSPTHE